MKPNLEAEKEIVEFLKKKGCCLRCCLRFVGLRTQEFYEEPEKVLKGIIDEPLSDEAPCIICIGILQDPTHEKVIEKVKAANNKKPYDCTTFICALTLPIVVRLRERSMYICMSKEGNFPEHILSALKLKVQGIKDIWKWVVGPKIEKVIGKVMDVTTPSPFLIEIFFTYPQDERECKNLLNHFNDKNKKSQQKTRKYDDAGFSRKGTETLMNVISDSQFAQYFEVPPTLPTAYVNVEDAICSHSSIFIGGRYNKLSRSISQTPWFINGEKKMETCVQDLLCNPIAAVVKAESIKFLSSGREDVDVRNIHGGRPFAVELVDPSITNITDEMLTNLMEKINSSTNQAQITSKLKVVSRFDLKRLKEGENAKTKIYRALCVCRTPIKDPSRLEALNQMKNTEIVQKTPVRVLHRRPLSPRIRIVHDMRVRWAKPSEIKTLLKTNDIVDKTFFVLDIKVQAGTYIKEFVHGDFGRTTPNLCGFLGTEVDIVALDVTGINLDWP